jgi:hypothetical protein
MSGSDGPASNSSHSDASEGESEENDDIQDPVESSLMKDDQPVGVVEPTLGKASRARQMKKVNPERHSLEIVNASSMVSQHRIEYFPTMFQILL